MMAVEVIFVHQKCKSQLTITGSKQAYCEVCGRTVRPDEILEADNTPSPFAG
jgi:hypothetical protein